MLHAMPVPIKTHASLTDLLGNLNANVKRQTAVATLETFMKILKKLLGKCSGAMKRP
jgi:hypothetical protein